MKSTSCLHEINTFEKTATSLRKLSDSNALRLSASYPWQASASGNLQTESTPLHVPPDSGLEMLGAPQPDHTCAHFLASHSPRLLTWSPLTLKTLKN